MEPKRLWGNKGFSMVVSLEPPKGGDLSAMLKNGERLKGRIDAAIISDSPDAIMRMTPLAACLALHSTGIRPVMCINGRDRNRLAIQGDLLGAWAGGICDIIIEEGKDPSYGDHPLTKPVTDLDREQMVKTVAELNAGKDLAGQSLKGPTNFNFGAYVHWLDDDAKIEQEFKKMSLLAEAGAKVFITSPQFDLQRTKDLLNKAKSLDVSVLVTVMLLKSVGMARYLNEVPGISKVPDAVIEKMNNAPVKAKAGIDLTVEFIRSLEGIADGVVLSPIGWEHKVPEILDSSCLEKSKSSRTMVLHRLVSWMIRSMSSKRGLSFSNSSFTKLENIRTPDKGLLIS